MTINDFMKRISESDKDKMIVFVGSDGGWSNININVTDTQIEISPDMELIFSSDK